MSEFGEMSALNMALMFFFLLFLGVVGLYILILLYKRHKKREDWEYYL